MERNFQHVVNMFMNSADQLPIDGELRLKLVLFTEILFATDAKFALLLESLCVLRIACTINERTTGCPN